MSKMDWYKGVTYNGREWVDSDCGAFVRYTSLSKLLAANAHIFTDDDIAPLMALREQYGAMTTSEKREPEAGIDDLAYRFWSIHPNDIPDPVGMPEGYKGGARAWFYATEIRRKLSALRAQLAAAEGARDGAISERDNYRRMLTAAINDGEHLRTRAERAESRHDAERTRASHVVAWARMSEDDPNRVCYLIGNSVEATGIRDELGHHVRPLVFGDIPQTEGGAL